MEGWHTPSVSADSDLTESRTVHRDQSHDSAGPCGDPVPESPDRGSLPVSAEERSSFRVDVNSDLLDEMDDSGLLRSFDMVFQVHQRSEEIRKHLDKIDGILLTSRTIPELAERLISVLRKEMGLPAARLVFRQNHPMASLVGRTRSNALAVVPDALFEDERFAHTDPFILADPSDSIGKILFGDTWNKVCSAAVAILSTETEKIGAICLGGSDPHRYRCDMNTDLVSSLAKKIAIGLINAWDHETSPSRAIFDGPDRVHSEGFFFEYLQKEFHRAWRAETAFSLMSLAWKSLSGAEPRSLDEISELLVQNIRSADLLARCGTNDLWILLPATPLDVAKTMAERLIGITESHFIGSMALHIGIAGFSQNTTVMGVLMNQALAALERAALSEDSRIEVETFQPAAK